MHELPLAAVRIVKVRTPAVRMLAGDPALRKPARYEAVAERRNVVDSPSQVIESPVPAVTSRAGAPILLERLPSHRVPQATDWAKLSHVWMARIDERIAELGRLRSTLTGCIGCGCLSLETCQLANPGDRAHRRGPGPRYWMGDKAPLPLARKDRRAPKAAP